MKPVKPHGANFTYKRPRGREDIGDLEVIRVSPGHIRSHWRLNDDERNWLMAGGHIELDIMTEPIPPVAVNCATPECPECMVEMELVERDTNPIGWHFRCPDCSRWA